MVATHTHTDGTKERPSAGARSTHTFSMCEGEQENIIAKVREERDREREKKGRKNCMKPDRKRERE